MNKLTEREEIQFTEGQLAACKEAATKCGLKLAAWIRMVALRASREGVLDNVDQAAKHHPER